MPETERKEQEPKITVEFFFALHGTGRDFDRLPKLLEMADVFAPEAPGLNEKGLKLLNSISQGEVDPADMADIYGPETAVGFMWHSIYNTKKPIIFIDIPEGSPLMKKGERVHGSEALAAVEQFLAGKFDEALATEKKRIKILDSYVKEREEFIRAQLKREVRTLTNKFPQLKGKVEIHILVGLGSYHTEVANKLKKESSGFEVEKTFSRSPMVRPIAVEMQYSIATGKDMSKYDDTSYARSILTDLIASSSVLDITDSAKKHFIIRKLVEKLSLSQIRDLSETLSSTNMSAGVATLLRAKLRRLGVTIPKTEEEADRLFGSQGKGGALPARPSNKEPKI